MFLKDDEQLPKSKYYKMKIKSFLKKNKLYLLIISFFILIILPLSFYAIKNNSPVIASFIASLATFFILLVNIWDTNKKLENQSINNKKNLLLELKYSEMKKDLKITNDLIADILKVYNGITKFESDRKITYNDNEILKKDLFKYGELIPSKDFLVLMYSIFQDKTETSNLPSYIKDLLMINDGKIIYIITKDKEKSFIRTYNTPYYTQLLNNYYKIINTSSDKIENQKTKKNLGHTKLDLYLHFYKEIRGSLIKNPSTLGVYCNNNSEEIKESIRKTFYSILSFVNKKGYDKIILDDILDS
ncbi:hypothetical protein SDC9_21220 [bioreactor metagenome]|uniref:Uncharacterized protein n=1 Tax=bioreactor metagenome TaxID=1076179 RepID=A0A644U8X2_9ZZZZ|nr:hypothetical protein [Methanobrevibacter sp.]MEA4957987.1 hypothetical protein [Methanobrevibacter sp.]